MAQLLYSTDFENIIKVDSTTCSIPLLHGIMPDPAGSWWMEGTPIAEDNPDFPSQVTTGFPGAHSGKRCLGFALSLPPQTGAGRYSEFNLNVAGWNEFFIRVWRYYPADFQLHGSYHTLFSFTDGAPNYVPTITANLEDNDLVVYSSDGELGRISNFSLPRGRWFKLEYYFLRDSLSGKLQIWIDGTLIGNFSGINTRGSGASPYTAIGGLEFGTADTFTPYQTWFDDLEVWGGMPSGDAYTVYVASSPINVPLLVDNAAAGNTPIYLSLGVGQHSISVPEEVEV